MGQSDEQRERLFSGATISLAVTDHASTKTQDGSLPSPPPSEADIIEPCDHINDAKEDSRQMNGWHKEKEVINVRHGGLLNYSSSKDGAKRSASTTPSGYTEGNIIESESILNDERRGLGRRELLPTGSLASETVLYTPRILRPSPEILPRDATDSPLFSELKKNESALRRRSSKTATPAIHITTELTDSSATTPHIANGLDILSSSRTRKLFVETGTPAGEIVSPQPRPVMGRALSTPATARGQEPGSGIDFRQNSAKPRATSKPDGNKPKATPILNSSVGSPMPASIPLPPLSLPTYLQLELSSHRPSQLYIHRPVNSDFPYESSRVKIERLLNFMLLPHQLESVLWFGTLACLDSWLYTFTILPLRLIKAIYILVKSLVRNLVSELQFISSSILSGTQRMWKRRRDSSRQPSSRKVSDTNYPADRPPRIKPRENRNHHRSKSVPSMLLPDDKADILKSLLIICTCLILMKLDASKMYHWVRGQAAIKLYVIYNVLEVCDRLLSAIGQDVLECLFSQEALERKPDGHSKLLRPFWLFILALFYTTLHATALFYQVVALNVAVNSYSNALITLLMSNQFVEIKSTVFKKFEKENLFQLTCADVVERFQLWHMLMIIAARNVVETGGWDWGFNALASPIASSAAAAISDSSNPVMQAIPPMSVSSILPLSFTFVTSLTAYVPTIGHVLGPFIMVLGSEMLIDWLKHAYVNKFNNTRPVIYGRFLDILAKDYYTNAFGDQNLTKRLGLPVIPLSCLMIRASFQTYQMFVAAWLPPPSQSSASLASIHQQYSVSRGFQPTSTAATVARSIDELLYQLPSKIADSAVATHFTTILIMLLIFLVLLACKLVLGMMLLAFARARYRSMKERERNPPHYVDGGRRVGGWGVVEVDDDKRRWIYDDDPAGLRAVRERENKEAAKRDAEREKGGNVDGLDRVKRYEMVAKRIW